MRIFGSSAVLFCASFFAFSIVQQTTPNTAYAATCHTGNGIGVHRTVDLSTKGGARFGSSHGGHHDFLKNKEIVLTFDDGPVPGKTTKILQTLDKHCAKATFFMVGTMAKHHASLARKVAAEGHTVGIHSYSHKNLGHLSGSAAVEDVERSIRTIRKAAGPKTTRFFRFPYLSENKSVNARLSDQDYGIFAIDVDSLDYRMPSATALINRVMSELQKRGKGIILLHDIQAVTANGLDELLTRLDDSGYKLVHVRGAHETEPEPLLVADATPLKNTSKSSSRSKATTSPGKKARNAVRKRTGLAQIHKSQIKLARLQQQTNDETTKAAFMFSKAFRATIKKRIFVKERPSKTNAKTLRKVSFRSNTDKPGRKNNVLLSAKRNQKALRRKLKQRLITY